MWRHLLTDYQRLEAPQTGATAFQTQTTEGQGKRDPADQLFGARIEATTSIKHMIAYINGNDLADSLDPPWFNFPKMTSSGVDSINMAMTKSHTLFGRCCKAERSKFEDYKPISRMFGQFFVL
jgi:hypothetical protein